MNVEKIISSIEKTNKLLKSKKFANVICLFFTVVLFFTVFSEYSVNAQEGSEEEVLCYDAMEGWKIEAEMDQGYTQVDGSAYSASGNQLRGITMMLNDKLIGTQNCEYETIASNDEIPGYSKGDILSMVEGSIAVSLANPPRVDVVAHLGEQWIPGQQSTYSTFAADGYSYMRGLGIDTIWSVTRNIAYILFVIIMIVTGFMIMFRQKIGGQVAITVFNSIPNIIVGLLLVTFSFGIAGLILNIGSFLTNIIASFIYGSDTTSAIYVTDFFSLMFRGTTSFESMAGALIPTAIISFVVGLIAAAAIPALGVGALVGGTIAATFVIGIIILILALLYLYAGARVWFTLFKAFLSIIFDTIMGPLVLTFGSLPGQSQRQMGWVLKLLKNSLVFPIVFFLVNLPNYLSLKGIAFDPTGVIKGDFVGGDAGLIEAIVVGILPLVLYFFAADAPKILDDLIPADGSKGVAAAVQGTMGAIKKIPILGSFMG